MKTALVALSVAVLVAACSTADQGRPTKAAPPAGAAKSVTAGHFGAERAYAAPADARILVRSGSIEVLVAAPEQAARELSAAVEAMGGFVSDSRTSEDSVHLTARVPAARLEEFLDAAAALGEEETRSIAGRDVTDEYADLEAEIGNLVSLRGRLRTLLDRARTVEEVLGVERELTRIQTRIDALERRRQRIEKDVARSRVDVYLSKQPEPRILGPLGLLYEGFKWVFVKLWVVSP